LRGDAPDGDMQRMISKQEFRASGQGFQGEILAALPESSGFAAEVGVHLALLSKGNAD